MARLLITTTNTVENTTIEEYYGILEQSILVN